jgi:tight adherence protein B
VHINLILLSSFLGITALSAFALLAAKNLFASPGATAVEVPRLRQFPQASADGQASVVGRFDHWLTRSLYLSGLQMTVATATCLLLLVGLTVSGVAFLLTDSPLLTLAGAVLSMGGVLSYVGYAHWKRLRKFQDQFPAALDLLARAVRAGESLDQAIELVCNSSPDPLATEFRRVLRQLEMGLSVSAAMEAMDQRLGLMDVRIFSSAISVHRDSGGSIAETLERLARVIRDRMNYHRHLRAVTGAGRASVMLIAALGPILFTYLFLVQPDYGQALWQDATGKLMLITAVALELVGLLWVWRLLKADY